MPAELTAVQAELDELRAELAAQQERHRTANPAYRGHLEPEMNALKAKIQVVHTRELQLLDANQTAERAHQLQQDAFWFQRFNTALAVAHAGGFAAVTAHAFDPATTQQTVGLALPALINFGVGLTVAGAIPVTLVGTGVNGRKWAGMLAGSAAVLFVLALCWSIGGVALKSVGQIWVWQPYPASTTAAKPAPAAL